MRLRTRLRHAVGECGHGTRFAMQVEMWFELCGAVCALVSHVRFGGNSAFAPSRVGGPDWVTRDGSRMGLTPTALEDGWLANGFHELV